MKDIGRCVQDYNLVSSGENALRFVKINCKAMAKPSLSLRNSVATGHRADLNCLCFLTVETRSVECGVWSAQCTERDCPVGPIFVSCPPHSH